MKRGYITTIFLALGGVVVWLLLVEKISPLTVTKSDIAAIKWRLCDYVSSNHRLPKTLSELPHLSPEGDSTLDAWGRPLIYSPQPDGTVILGSHGSDGKSDFTVQFAAGVNK